MLVNTLLLLATCPVSLNCSVTHEQRGALTQCCFNDGPHFQRSGDVETVLFQCITLITFGILYLWNIQSNFTLISLITFGVLNQTSPNLQGSCRNTCRWCLRNYMINGKELTSELMSKWITFKNTQANLTLISLITFEVLHQTSSYLQGSCRDISWRCLQNYVKIGWELTEIPAKIG